MAYGHDHPEAFMVMRYESTDGSIVEHIWNSRDGVTPFCITALDGTTELRHTRWNEDRYCPDHAEHMVAGMRYFTDLDPEAALMMAEGRVEAWWDHPQYPMRGRWPTKDEAAKALAKDYLSTPGSPHIKVWL